MARWLSGETLSSKLGRLLLFALGVLLALTGVASAVERQFMLPDGSYVHDTSTDKEYAVTGESFVDEAEAAIVLQRGSGLLLMGVGQ